MDGCRPARHHMWAHNAPDVAPTPTSGPKVRPWETNAPDVPEPCTSGVLFRSAPPAAKGDHPPTREAPTP